MAKQTPVKPTIPIKVTNPFGEFIKNYWGYFMTVVTAVTFVWTLGVKSERKDNEKISLKKDVTEIKFNQLTDSRKLDSLIVIVWEIKLKTNDVVKNQNLIIDNQNFMKESWIKYLANDKSLTKKDFVQYMDELKLQLIPKIPEEKIKPPKLDPNIIITPIEPKEKNE